MRPLMISLHRYAGLSLAGFLVLAGLTGSLLAFQHEIDAWLNPDLFQARTAGPSLSPSQLVAGVERFDSRADVSQVTLATTPSTSAILSVSGKRDARTGEPYALGYSQVFVDPATGQVLGTRRPGACCLQRENFVPFVYELHFTLQLPTTWGVWLLGGVAVLWLFDSFIGVLLTLPASATGRPARAFIERWKPAWKIKLNASSSRVTYDIHRASGLWFWLVFFVLAMSSIKLNLNQQVFTPIVSFFSSLTPSVYDTRQAAATPTAGALSFDDALARAQAEATRRHWAQSVTQLYHSTSYRLYGARFGEWNRPGLGRSWLYFDDHNGSLIGEAIPGSGTAGDLFSDIQLPLHSGRIIGLPGRILICLTGLAVAMLSITGIWVWWRKRRTSRYAAASRVKLGKGLRPTLAQTTRAVPDWR